jgi:hypothetical protein
MSNLVFKGNHPDVREITVNADGRTGMVTLALRPTPEEDGWVDFPWEVVDDYIDVFPTSCCGMYHINDSRTAEEWLIDVGDDIASVLNAAGINPFEPLASPQDYAKDNGAFCPVCRSNNLESGEVEYGGAGLRFEDCSCVNCGAWWVSVFELIGYRDLDDVPGRPPKPLTDIFRELDAAEEAEFRKWARDNWKPGMPISDVWHPAVRDEIRKMQEELNG